MKVTGCRLIRLSVAPVPQAVNFIVTLLKIGPEIWFHVSDLFALFRNPERRGEEEQDLLLLCYGIQQWFTISEVRFPIAFVIRQPNPYLLKCLKLLFVLTDIYIFKVKSPESFLRNLHYFPGRRGFRWFTIFVTRLQVWIHSWTNFYFLFSEKTNPAMSDLLQSAKAPAELDHIQVKPWIQRY